MATAYHNLSEYDFNSVPNAEGMKFGIVVSEWNFNITGALLKGAVDTLKKHGAKDENILVKTVPGSFELTFGANQMMDSSDGGGRANSAVGRIKDRSFAFHRRISQYFYILKIRIGFG